MRDSTIQHVQSGYGSALAAAAYRNNISILKFLTMESGANVAHKLEKCRVYKEALAEAAKSDNLDALKFFLVLELPAATNLQLQRDIHDSALNNAVKRGHVEIVKFLVQEMDAEANIHVPTNNGGGFTILGCALIEDQIEIAQILIKEGALVNLDLGDGRFANALEAGEAEVLEELMHWEPQSNIEEWKEGVAEILESLGQVQNKQVIQN